MTDTAHEVEVVDLEHLDWVLELPCEWFEHDPVTGEKATHVGRSTCPTCGWVTVKLLGEACVTYLATHDVWCQRCTHFPLPIQLSAL